MFVRLCFCVVSALTIPAFTHAGLLHYDLDFETYDSEHFTTGTGFLLADTELDAVIGGQLVCDEFVFSWSNGSPDSLTRLDDYYGSDVVSGGVANGTDELTGEAGTFDLMFLLWPPAGEGEGYADKLASHFPEDIWSTIHLPSDSRPDDHWMNSPLTTHFTLDSPVNVVFDEGADVAGPASLPLLLIGGTLLMVRRFRPIA